MESKARPSGPSENSLRDIGLVLFGLCLSKSERERVLNTLPANSMPHEIENLMNAVRTKQPKDLNAWLESRCAYMEKGKDAVQAMCDAILAENKRQQVKRIIGQLSFASSIEDPVALKERLKECMTLLEAVT